MARWSTRHGRAITALLLGSGCARFGLRNGLFWGTGTCCNFACLWRRGLCRHSGREVPAVKNQVVAQNDPHPLRVVVSRTVRVIDDGTDATANKDVAKHAAGDARYGNRRSRRLISFAAINLQVGTRSMDNDTSRRGERYRTAVIDQTALSAFNRCTRLGNCFQPDSTGRSIRHRRTTEQLGSSQQNRGLNEKTHKHSKRSDSPGPPLDPGSRLGESTRRNSRCFLSLTLIPA